MSAIDNRGRDARKQQLEKELCQIQVDELVEASLEKGSWFRENLQLAPETSSYWTALRRYIYDCVKVPSHVTGTEMELYREQAIQKYQRAYK